MEAMHTDISVGALGDATDGCCWAAAGKNGRV